MFRYLILILVGFLFFTLPVAANAQASCDQAMSLSKTCGNDTSCMQRAGDLFTQCADDKRNKVESGTSCRDTADACAYRCGDNANYTSGNIQAEMDRHQSCLKRCSDTRKSCRKAERNRSYKAPTPRATYAPMPEPTYTPPAPSANVYGSGAGPSTKSYGSSIPNGNTASNTQSYGSGSVYSPPSTVDTEETKLVIECANKGGTMLDGSCSIKEKTTEDIRKELGTDLETMKAVSDLGGRNARTCVGSETDSEGFLYVKNICGKPVNFGYCYDDWVPKRPTASNPFKCDTTGKLAWGGASSVRGSQEWRAPLQADSVSRKLIFGPCMAEIFYNDRKYSYLHSRRTSAPFKGGSGKYKCIYQKSAGQP